MESFQLFGLLTFTEIRSTPHDYILFLINSLVDKCLLQWIRLLQGIHLIHFLCDAMERIPFRTRVSSWRLVSSCCWLAVWSWSQPARSHPTELMSSDETSFYFLYLVLNSTYFQFCSSMVHTSTFPKPQLYYMIIFSKKIWERILLSQCSLSFLLWWWVAMKGQACRSGSSTVLLTKLIPQHSTCRTLGCFSS